MVEGVLILAGVVGAIALLLLMVFRRDLVGVDLSARSLLRLYTFVASLAAAIVFTVGATWILDGAMASVFGKEAVYGRPPVEMVCPVSEKCPDPAQLARQYEHERDLRRDQNLIGGATLAIFGAIFWAGHHFAGRAFAHADEKASALRRSYLTLGTFVFGLATLALLPVGVYQALSVVLLQPGPDVYKPGLADSLSGGIVALPIWLLYLMPLVRTYRLTSSTAGT